METYRNRDGSVQFVVWRDEEGRVVQWWTEDRGVVSDEEGS